MHQTHPTNADVDTFVLELQTIDWFSNLGQPLPAELSTKQIFHSDDWLGPDEGNQEFHTWHASLYQDLFSNSDFPGIGQLKLWDHLHHAVLQHARQKVPYDPHQDAWHAPTTAVWSAAYTASLLGLYLFQHRDAPAFLHRHWLYYLHGHWPCDWTTDQPPKIMVF